MRRIVGQVQETAVKAGEQIGLGRLARFDIVTNPDAAAAERGAEAVEFLRLDKPEIRLRLSWAGDLALRGAGVEKFGFRRVVGAEDDTFLPASEVADHTKVGGPLRDAGGIGGAECARKSPKGAM